MKQLEETKEVKKSAPRFRYWATPPEFLAIRVADLAPLVPAENWRPDARRDGTFDLPTADVFSKNVPRISLRRLAQLFPGHLLESDGSIKLPAAHLASAFRFVEQREELPPEPEPEIPVDLSKTAGAIAAEEDKQKEALKPGSADLEIGHEPDAEAKATDEPPCPPVAPPVGGASEAPSPPAVGKIPLMRSGKIAGLPMFQKKIRSPLEVGASPKSADEAASGSGDVPPASSAGGQDLPAGRQNARVLGDLHVPVRRPLDIPPAFFPPPASESPEPPPTLPVAAEPVAEVVQKSVDEAVPASAGGPPASPESGEDATAPGDLHLPKTPPNAPAPSFFSSLLTGFRLPKWRAQESQAREPSPPTDEATVSQEASFPKSAGEAGDGSAGGPPASWESEPPALSPVNLPSEIRLPEEVPAPEEVAPEIGGAVAVVIEGIPPEDPPAPTLVADAAPAITESPEPPASELSPLPAEVPMATRIHTETVLREVRSHEIAEQEPLQALFMTDETMSVDRVIELCGGFPGINSCVLAQGSVIVASHKVPEGVDLISMSAHAADMLRSMRESTARMGVGAVPAVTLHTEKGVISFFHRDDLTMLVFHRDRGFIPGVREKMAAILGELTKARLTLPAGTPQP